MKSNTKLEEVLDFLMQPHKKKQEVRRMENTIADLRGCLIPGAVRYDKDKIQTSPKNQQEETILRIIDYEEKLNQLKCELASSIIKVNEAIELLDDETERAVLTYYYVNRYSPRRVANLIGYSERWMYKIKREAVLKLFSEVQYKNML